MWPAAQAANFSLLDLQLTEADRRPFKLPLQLGELSIEPAEERLSSLRVALGLLSGEEGVTPI